IIVVIERAHHLLEGADAALAVKGRAVIAGTPDGADAKSLDGDCVELAVAMQRDQHLGPMGRLGLDERRQEMLAMPEREDRGELPLDPLVEGFETTRLEGKAVGPPDEAQPFGREEARNALKPAAAQRIAKQPFQRVVFASSLISCAGSSSRCRCTMKKRIWALSTVACAFAFHAA